MPPRWLRRPLLPASGASRWSWRCSRCGRKTQVTVPLVKTDNTDSIAKKLAGAINAAVAGSDNVRVQYYQSSKTKKQDQNWYRIRFTGDGAADDGAAPRDIESVA